MSQAIRLLHRAASPGRPHGFDRFGRDHGDETISNAPTPPSPRPSSPGLLLSVFTPRERFCGIDAR
eukprot:9479014-Pyramimonas_sp.AAC.1